MADIRRNDDTGSAGNPRLSVAMEAKIEELPALQAAVAKFGSDQGWPTEWEYQVELAIEELIVNIVNYGFKNQTGRVELALDSAADVLTIDIIDNGIPFDPFKEAPPPDLESDVESRPIGGLGVHFVKTMMDEVRYAHENDRNHITLVKRREN